MDLTPRMVFDPSARLPLPGGRWYLAGAGTWRALASDCSATDDADAVVSHRSAPHVRGLGDLIPRVHEFYVPSRVRLRRNDLKLRVRPGMARSDWSLSGGLSVCTIERIVADLLADREDESAVAQIAGDGIRDGLLARDVLERAAARYGTEYGYRSATEFATVLAGGQE